MRREENRSEVSIGHKCYLTLDVFRSGTMHVEKRPFCRQYVQIKYFEASWPAADSGVRLAQR